MGNFGKSEPEAGAAERNTTFLDVFMKFSFGSDRVNSSKSFGIFLREVL